MTNKITTVLKDNKLLAIIMAASVLMLLVGVILINAAPDPESGQEPIQSEAEPEFSDDVITSADQATVLIDELSQTSDSSQMPAVNVLRGSEEWCEAMMLKADADWNEADTQLFAQKCLEPEADL